MLTHMLGLVMNFICKQSVKILIWMPMCAGRAHREIYYLYIQVTCAITASGS